MQLPVDAEDLPPAGGVSRVYAAAAVLWPSFLGACLVEMLVFDLVDPADMHGLGGLMLDWSPQSVYTLMFFLFWVIISGAAALSGVFLARVWKG